MRRKHFVWLLTCLVSYVLFQWEQYMKCDGLPNPASLSEMNTYIYLWRAVEKRGLLGDVVKKTSEVLGVSVLFSLIGLNIQ
jgi:hypothetical protein